MRMATLDMRALLLVLPEKAAITVVDSAFHQMGDVNWDGKINQADVDLIKAAWLSKPGDPNWNPDADLNGDGIVNILDVSPVTANFGKTAAVYATPAKADVADGLVAIIGQNSKNQILKRQFNTSAGKRIIFIFTPMKLWGRVIVSPI